MTTFSDSDYFLKLDSLWEEQSFIDTGWSGYGLLTTEQKLTPFAFLDLPASPEPLLELFAKHNIQAPRLIRIRFKQMPTGTIGCRIGPYQPGGLLYTTSRDSNCHEGCHGTLGALVTNDTGPIWMLSNQHILAKDSNCITSTEVRGPGNICLTNTVVPCSSAEADAAIARVRDGQRVFPIYEGIDITCPEPIWPALQTEMQKLGCATGPTSGIFVGCAHQVRVFSCDSSTSTSEFENQLIISSKAGEKPFLAKGDSGSLVVNAGHPAGLLFAISDQVNPDDLAGFPGQIPIGLANPFGKVLDALPSSSQKWHMLLDPSQQKCTLDHSQDLPMDCKSKFIAEFATEAAKRT